MSDSKRTGFTAESFVTGLSTAAMLMLAHGCDDGTSDDVDYRQAAAWTDTDGTSTSYDDSGTTGTSTSTGTPGLFDLGGWTSSTTGPYCIVEEPEECCIAACASGAKHPVPGDPTNFDCPVANMEYNCNCPGTDLFDCDDFAYACENWGKNQGYNICTYVYFYTKPTGSTGGHAINIVEFEYDGPLAKYCFIEPQSNTSKGCWIQEEGEPDPPDSVKDALCAASGGTCDDDEITCDAEHSDNAGEVCFNTLPAVCSRFRAETGLCPFTFEDDHDCSDADATGDPCYWSCQDDEVCGSACFQCDPASGGSTSGGSSSSGSSSSGSSSSGSSSSSTGG